MADKARVVLVGVNELAEKVLGIENINIKIESMATISRGSEWRKWDLHVHTKNTNKNDQFTSVDFEAFCKFFFKRAIENDIEVIGVTDYFCIDNYKKVIEYQDKIQSNTSFSDEEKAKIQNIFILPNVELRMLPVTDAGRLINIHCLFNPNYLAHIDNDFFNSLKHTSHSQDFLMNYVGLINLGKQVDKTITDDNIAYKKGIENFVVSHSDFKRVLSSNDNLRNNVIIVVSNSNKDGNSGLQKHFDLFENGAAGSLDDIRQTIYHLSDCIFSSNDSDIQYFLGKKKDDTNGVIRKCGSLKPCIHGSDAHTEEKLFSPDKNRFCWIKANPTFEGLRQILFEPEERVKIQETKPEEKSGYQVIDSVILNETHFWNETIHFNENLNAIIGGRSTGKSTLLKAIANKIDKKINSEDEFVKNHLSGVAVKWKDGEETASRDIDFFPQSYMYEIAKDQRKTNKLIQDIIRNRTENEILEEFKSQNENLKKAIAKGILEIFQTQSDIENLQEQLKEKGDKKGVENEIERLKSKINDLSKNSMTSEEELRLYRELLQEISDCERLISQADNDLKLFERMKVTTPINNSYPTENGFDKLSFLLNVDELSRHFENLTIKTEKEWQEIVENFVISTNSGKTQNTSRIENIKQNSTFIKVTRYYNDNKELNDVQLKLKEENRKLQEISQLEKQISNLITQKNTAQESIVENHLSYKTKTDAIVSSLSIEFDGVKITLKMNFQKESLKNYIESRLNQRGTERQSFIDTFINQYESKTSEQCNIFLSKALTKEIDYKSYNTNQNVVNELYTTNWFDFSYELSYQNDTFSEMSEGKQAFVILKLLLDFSTKKCPILIDQPEDSLDNRAIYNELVQYLKTKKKERQIILVTHNPNVVVSADAENVIVANQSGNNCLNIDNIKFQYINGALEDTSPTDKNATIILDSQGIREHVCEILEGGQEAFEKREKKYGFKTQIT